MMWFYLMIPPYLRRTRDQAEYITLKAALEIKPLELIERAVEEGKIPH